MRVAIAGEALIDFISEADGRFNPCLGGAVYNLARALSRQGLGTLYLNPFSSDKLGQALMQQMVAKGEVDALGLDNVRDMVDNYRQQFGVEVYVNLDHSPSVDSAKEGIDAGFE